MKIVRFFVLSLVFFFALLSYGKPKLVLMTSIPEGGADLAALENLFRESFKPEEAYEVEVIHHAHLDQLFRTLQSPETSALFWMSHGFKDDGVPALSTGGVYDWQGFELSRVFFSLKSTLKFLSVLSCHADTVLKGLSGVSQSTEVFLSQGRVQPVSELSIAIQKWHTVQGDLKNFSEVQSKSPQEKLKISRKCVDQAPAVRVHLQSEAGPLVTTFPPCDELDQEQEADVDPGIRRIVITSGVSVRAKKITGLGEFKIGSPGWKRFPAGVMTLIYNRR